MSATHILTTAGAIRCGRKQVRGFITADQYQHLTSQGPLPERIYTRADHTCSYREGDKCYTFGGSKKVEHHCPRRKRSVVAVCSDCRSRSYENNKE